MTPPVSRSLKVIRTGTDWSSTCDVLSTFRSKKEWCATWPIKKFDDSL